MTVAVQDDDVPTSRAKVRADGTCYMSGCLRPATSSEVPFCTEHVESRPYAALVAAEVARRAADVAAVGGGAPVDLRGPVVSGMVLYLIERGRASAEKLAQELTLTEPQAQRYVMAMLEDGMVTMVQAKRGARYVLERRRAMERLPGLPWDLRP